MTRRTRTDHAQTRGETLTGKEEKLDDLDPRDEVDVQSVKSATTRRRDRPEPGPKVERNAITKKSYAKQSSSAASTPAVNNLKDSVRPGLILISVGLNPGIMTGQTGHAYAHPSNRYWPTLFASGITPVQHKPSETLDLMDLYGMGHTNIIPTKATVGGNDLTKEDYMNGAQALEDKIRELRPQAAMIVGKGIWEEWFRYKRGRKMTKKDGFEYGWQDEQLNIGREEGVWDGPKTFVVTTTSGLSSAHTKEERVAIWKPMGDWFTPKREEWIRQQQQTDS